MGGGFRIVGAWLPVLLVCASCSMPTVSDLRRNNQLYRDTGYKVKVPADRAAFVRPMENNVQGGAVEASLVEEVPETAWDRAYVDMFDDILRDELDDSGVVAEVKDLAAPEDIVIRTRLRRCTMGFEEQVVGQLTFAAVEIRVQVLGPVGADGDRPVLRDKAYGDALRSDAALSPTPPALLMGTVLRTTMAAILRDLDTACVARKNVPASMGKDGVDDWGPLPSDKKAKDGSGKSGAGKSGK